MFPNHIFTVHFFSAQSIRTNFWCKWMLWSMDLKLCELLCCNNWHRVLPLVFLNLDVIVSLIKSFYLIKGHLRQHRQWKVNCGPKKCKIKVIQKITFPKSRNLSVAKYVPIETRRKRRKLEEDKNDITDHSLPLFPTRLDKLYNWPWKRASV